MAYPYKVDYNDHFETPMIAYRDILPLLDAVGPSLKKGVDKKRHYGANDKKGRSQQVIYDPYYCDGRVARLLNELGFKNIKHEKRDFYEDVKNNIVPMHDTFITNPPYSGDHKERCVRFAVDNLRQKFDTPTPFFILMPNYIACRNHFRSVISPLTEGLEDPLDILYVVPSTPYEYEHPDGTGKDIPPFASIWFCGIPPSKIEAAKQAFARMHGSGSVGLQGGEPSNSKSPRLLSSLQELKTIGAVPTEKRKNMKQRIREKRRREKESLLAMTTGTQDPTETKIPSVTVAEKLSSAKQRRREKRKKEGGNHTDEKIQEQSQEELDKMKSNSLSYVPFKSAKQLRREKRTREKGDLATSEDPKDPNCQSINETKGGALDNQDRSQESKSVSAIPLDKLKNAKKRRREKRKTDVIDPSVAPVSESVPQKRRLQRPTPEIVSDATNSAKKRSKYRDESGVRTKKRF